MSGEIVFQLTREDIVGEAVELGIPEEAITDEVLEQVKRGLEFGLECWTEVAQEAIKEAYNFSLKS